MCLLQCPKELHIQVIILVKGFSYQLLWQVFSTTVLMPNHCQKAKMVLLCLTHNKRNKTQYHHQERLQLVLWQPFSSKSHIVLWGSIVPHLAMVHNWITRRITIAAKLVTRIRPNRVTRFRYRFWKLYTHSSIPWSIGHLIIWHSKKPLRGRNHQTHFCLKYIEALFYMYVNQLSLNPNLTQGTLPLILLFLLICPLFLSFQSPLFLVIFAFSFELAASNMLGNHRGSWIFSQSNILFVRIPLHVKGILRCLNCSRP